MVLYWEIAHKEDVQCVEQQRGGNGHTWAILYFLMSTHSPGYIQVVIILIKGNSLSGFGLKVL